VFRRYADWSGRCSAWCECFAAAANGGGGGGDGNGHNKSSSLENGPSSSSSDRMECHDLGCQPDLRCQTPQTTVGEQNLYTYHS
jgi:hypothetical protein